MNNGKAETNVQPSLEINPQDIIDSLSMKLARVEAENSVKDATNIALSKRVRELEAIISEQEVAKAQGEGK